MKHITLSTLILTLLLPLAACGQAPQGGAAPAAKEATESTTHSIIAGEVQKAMAEAKQELATKNIDLNRVSVVHYGNDRRDSKDSLPRR